MSALGGTRTPNLLIRRNGRTVQACPEVAVCWADVPSLSPCIRDWLQPWQQCWQQPGHVLAKVVASLVCVRLPSSHALAPAHEPPRLTAYGRAGGHAGLDGRWRRAAEITPRSLRRGVDGQRDDWEPAARPRLPPGEVRCAGRDLRPQLVSFGVAGEVRVNVVLLVADLDAAFASGLEVQEPLRDCLGAGPSPSLRRGSHRCGRSRRPGPYAAFRCCVRARSAAAAGACPSPGHRRGRSCADTTRRSPGSLFERLSLSRDSSRPPALPTPTGSLNGERPSLCRPAVQPFLPRRIRPPAASRWPPAPTGCPRRS